MAQVWHNCYNESWKGAITPESFAHPAKFSRALIRRIYAYCIDQGWLWPGATVLDPFGGSGLGALDALANGINWVGIELESKFVNMGAGMDCQGISKADWVRFYGRWHKVPGVCPRCVDEARRVVAESPASQLSLFDIPVDHGPAYVRNSGQIPSSEPHRYEGNLDLFRKYARNGAQATLLQGDSRNLIEIIRQAHAEGVISSPPYINSVNQPAGANDTEARIERMKRAGIDVTNRANVGGANGVARQSQTYGQAPGQLGAMAEGNLDAVVGSPPFSGNSGGRGEASRQGIDAALFDRHAGGMVKGLSDAPGNLAGMPMNESEFAAVIGSPPFGQAETRNRSPYSGGYVGDMMNRAYTQDKQGADPGNLAHLVEGNLDTVIGSPPYLDGCSHRGGDDDPSKMSGGSRSVYGPGAASDGTRSTLYGDTPGQLAEMQHGSLDAVISSPPYAGTNTARNSTGVDLKKQYETYRASGGGMSFDGFKAVQEKHMGQYGDTPGQLSVLREGEFSAVIGSPPYASGEKGHPSLGSVDKDDWGTDGRNIARRRGVDGNYGSTEGQLAILREGDFTAVIGSPPFAESVGSDDPAKRGGILVSDPKRARDRNLTGTYGSTPGQLGAMTGMTGGFEAAIGSPPYEGSLDNSTIDPAERRRVARAAGISSAEHVSPIDMDRVSERDRLTYGSTPGQLGAMTGGFDASIGSPPYENRTIHGQSGIDPTKLRNPGKNSQATTMDKYGDTPGQLGNEGKETFWGASRQIVEQCYQALVPGGVAVWVCKDFIRESQRVQFSDMWRRLNEACGFESVESVRAMLVKELAVRHGLDGEAELVKKERKSFFRRIFEKKKPDLTIDWEDVVIMRKPC